MALSLSTETVIDLCDEGKEDTSRKRPRSGDSPQDLSTKKPRVTVPPTEHEDIIPVLNLIKKADSGVDLQSKDMLDCIVMMHAAIANRLGGMESRSIAMTSGLEEYIDSVNSKVTSQSTELETLSQENEALNLQVAALRTKLKRLKDQKPVTDTSKEESHTDTPQLPHDITILESDIIEEKGSSFQGFCAKVTKLEDVQKVTQSIRKRTHCSLATHMIMAYRLSEHSPSPRESCQDDGEQHAGGRLLRLLQEHDLSEVVVVVCRWYGGQHLGPSRFSFITDAARNALTKMDVNFSSSSADKRKTRSPKCLLLGSSLIRDVKATSTHDDIPVIVKKKSGAKFNDLTDAIDDIKDDSITRVLLVAGTREVDSDVPLEDVKDDVTTLITKAKSRFADVSLCSVLPRTDRDVLARQQSVNTIVSEACTEHEVTFINNDDNFLYRNGNVDPSSFQKDGVHLSAHGTTKLLTNLKLRPLSRTQRTTLQDQPPRTNQRKTYSDALRNGTPRPQNAQARCWFCAEPGHTKDQCGHGRKIQCNNCKKYGHKSKFCSLY